MKPELKILLLEDEPLDAELITGQVVSMEDYDCQVVWVKEKSAFEKELSESNYDLVLSDYNLLHFNGLDALKMVLAKNSLIPFIFVTGALDEETAVGTIKAGAWDYVVKDRLVRLSLAIKGALQLREEKLKAERSEKLKDAFLQNLSHEIRTPLNAIVGFSTLLNESNGFPEEYKEYTSIILSSSNQLLSIVNDVLTISRIQTGQEMVNTSEVYVNAVLDDLFAIFQPISLNSKIAFHLNKFVADRNFIVYTDEIKLNQILTNLLNNAFKYTHEGSVTLGYIVNDNSVEFFVSDTGIGIAPENMEVIFERFRQADNSFSRTYGGTGLGLSISKSFAQLLGGNISVKSTLHNGSSFYLSIPGKHNLRQVSGQIADKTMSARNLVILVAEDEKFNFRLIQTYLNMPNITLLHAFNGKEAIDLCQIHDNIDLILMDIKMPEMDGTTALSEIRKNRKMPVIAQTAYALEAEKLQLLKIGFNDYIAKPIRKDDLIDMIIKWTD